MATQSPPGWLQISVTKDKLEKSRTSSPALPTMTGYGLDP